MLPAPINITGQEAMGFFASFVFEPNVFERKKAERGSPFSSRSSSRRRGIPAKWSNVRRTDEMMTTQPVRRLEIHNPQHNSFAFQSNLNAKRAVSKKARTSKNQLFKFILINQSINFSKDISKQKYQNAMFRSIEKKNVFCLPFDPEGIPHV
jgi:hypothetical protein